MTNIKVVKKKLKIVIKNQGCQEKKLNKGIIKIKVV